ncbi:hypothetical protein LCGC14_1504610 [marine sediment metagenome]|uniref:tRNA dimethylallyltransferase n=2 Tax=root TaxID=1 RepID=A0A831QTB3_9FLAO|nr:tRNA (adenosine(37)-N6)-dimethylallyltransferase MiaA [Pricia sp.]HEA22407.1 tRNA (adenosine(37)-N6)-dimethylallyltransferase MiaA [Pricia antarctica]
MAKTLIAIVGPTAIGKTAMAITLAQHFDTEIISSDSRQFYREMQIGTAVPSKEELSRAKHHFIQHKSISDAYTVGDFEKEALEVLEELFKDNDTVIMVGGSGLYVDAVTQGLDKFPKINPEVRKGLNAELKENGIESLQVRLEKLDPDYYGKVDNQNPHRLIRALEVCLGSGKPYSYFLSAEKKARSFDILTVGITADRPLIYERINTRVDKMLADGLLAEVEKVLPYRELNALNTVGYKELFKYLDGTSTLEFAISEIKKNTRRFAKRQMTWFRKKEKTLWVPYNISSKELILKVKDKIV